MGFKIILFFWISVLIILAQENTYRRIEQQSAVNNFSTEYIFPFKKINTGTGVWTELNPKLPRTNYIGVYFINPETGWACGLGGAIIKTVNGGGDWTISNVPTTNTLLKLHSYTGITVLASGYDGLMFRSVDGGENFFQVMTGLEAGDDLWGLQMISDTLGWACGMNNSLIKTTDGGETWQSVSTSINTNYWWLDFLNEQMGFIACDGGVILKTIDGGNTWQLKQAGNNYALYSIDAIDSLHIVAGGANGKNVYSSDGGETWVENTRLIFDDVNCISFVDADTGYAIGMDWGIRKTKNRGQSWFASNINVGEWHLQLLDDFTAYCVGNGLKLNKATESYDNWKRLVINDGFGEIFFSNDEEGWVVGNGLYKTTNCGIDWVFQENFPYGLNRSIDQVYFINPDTGIIGRSPHEIELYKTTNGGANWERKPITGVIDSVGDIQKIFFINQQIGWAVKTRGGIIKTTNGGDSWFAQYNGFSFIIFKSIHFIDTLNGWTANQLRKPFRTTDGGNNWIEQTQLPFFNTSDVYFTHPDSGWILNDDDDYLYQTTDGGASWFQVFHSTTSWKRFYFFDNPDHWWISSISNIYETNDRGESWNIINVPILFSDFHSPSNAYGYACGGSGLILQYLDSSYIPVVLTQFTGEAKDQMIEISWSTATELNNYGFEILRLNNDRWQKIGFVPGHGTTTEWQHYFFVDKKINPAIYQYKLKQIDYNGKIVYYGPISVNAGEINTYYLFQNYPNPFNPDTKIKYQLPTESIVKIIIYNSLGELTEILIDGMKECGYHEIEWNAKSFASGVYLLVLEANSAVNLKTYRSVKKLILIK